MLKFQYYLTAMFSFLILAPPAKPLPGMDKIIKPQQSLPDLQLQQQPSGPPASAPATPVQEVPPSGGGFMSRIFGNKKDKTVVEVKAKEPTPLPVEGMSNLLK